MADPQPTQPNISEGNSEQSLEARVAALEQYMAAQTSAPAAAGGFDFMNGTVIEVPVLGSFYISREVALGTGKVAAGLLIFGVLFLLVRHFLRSRHTAK
jgi:hypothetical protein